MTSVSLSPNEPIERALRRLKTKIDAEGLLDEIRRLRAYESPSKRRKRKAKNHARRTKLKIRLPFSCPFPPSQIKEIDTPYGPR